MIRCFQKRDLPRLYQLDQICFPPEIAYSRAELQYFLAHPSCSCWIVESTVDATGEAIVAGFLIMERLRIAGRPAGHVVTVDVDPAIRRRGLGVMLMQTAEQQMQQDGAKRIRLEVAENNTAAKLFYRRLGFVSLGKIAKYYGGRIDANVLEKAIE